LDYGQPKKLLALCMPFEQQCFDLVFLLTGGQFLIAPPRSQIQRSIVVSVILVAAPHTTERLLVRSIRSIHIMAT
jgi:hypothetical protein